jgi:multidrug efflux system outer membrane protein
MSARAVLLATLLLAGCAVGPEYRRPSVATPAVWKSSTPSPAWKTAAPRDADARGAWWEIFGDDGLNVLAVQAVHGNHTLEAALARVVQARAAARLSRADLAPTLEANPSYSKFRRSLSSIGSAGRSIESETFDAPFDLSYEVDLWGKVRRAFQAAGAEAQAGAAAYEAVRLTLTAEVARTYFALRALDAEADALRQTVQLRRDALDLVRQRHEAGVAGELDVARVRTELANAEAESADVDRRRAELENALAVLVGKPASQFVLSRSPLAEDPPVTPPGLPSAVLERRPDVAEAERAMASANARIGVAQAAFFPVIRLTGSGGFVSTEVDSLFEWENRVWSLGPSVSAPLFAGGRNVANLQATRSAYDETVANYRQRVLVAFQEVEDALINLRLLAEQAEAQARVLTAAREAAAISMARYRQGLIGFLDVVDAERARLQAERAMAQVRGRRMAATVLLIKALGGGWDEPA